MAQPQQPQFTPEQQQQILARANELLVTMTSIAEQRLQQSGSVAPEIQFNVGSALDVYACDVLAYNKRGKWIDRASGTFAVGGVMPEPVPSSGPQLTQLQGAGGGDSLFWQIFAGKLDEEEK